MSVTSPVTSRVTSPVVSRVTDGQRRRVAFDADALSYIAAVEAADDEVLEAGVKSAINTFIIGCKADGIWDAIKASCILAGARTLAGCLVPLVGTAPTNVGPFVTGDYNRITGLKGNKSTKFLNSNRNNNADPQNDQHMSVFVGEVGSTDTGAGKGQAMIGAGIASEGTTTIHRSDDGTLFAYRNRSDAASTVTVTPARGFLGQARSASGAFSARAMGEADSFSVASQTPVNGNIVVFARSSVASPNIPTDYRLSFYSIGESLNLENLDTRVTRLLCEIEFGINTGLAGTGYDLDTLKYVNAGYAAGGTLA